MLRHPRYRPTRRLRAPPGGLVDLLWWPADPGKGSAVELHPGPDPVCEHCEEPCIGSNDYGIWYERNSMANSCHVQSLTDSQGLKIQAQDDVAVV